MIYAFCELILDALSSSEPEEIEGFRRRVLQISST